MKKKYLSKFNIKDKTAAAELARAHGMIILLVIALMFILTLANVGTIADSALNPTLTFIVIVLLGIVGLISLSVIMTLLRKR